MSLNPFAQIFDAKIIHPSLISKKKNKEKLKQITFLYINFISGPDPRIKFFDRRDRSPNKESFLKKKEPLI